MRIRVIATMLAVILTAKLGKVQFQGHTETYYNLNMNRVVSRTNNELGVQESLYWEREDGCKMYGLWVIVAAHPSVARYSFVETSRGMGIVLDSHTTSDKNLYDIATTW